MAKKVEKCVNCGKELSDVRLLHIRFVGRSCSKICYDEYQAKELAKEKTNG